MQGDESCSCLHCPSHFAYKVAASVLTPKCAQARQAPSLTSASACVLVIGASACVLVTGASACVLVTGVSACVLVIGPNACVLVTSASACVLVTSASVCVTSPAASGMPTTLYASAQARLALILSSVARPKSSASITCATDEAMQQGVPCSKVRQCSLAHTIQAGPCCCDATHYSPGRVVQAQYNSLGRVTLPRYNAHILHSAVASAEPRNGSCAQQSAIISVCVHSTRTQQIMRPHTRASARSHAGTTIMHRCPSLASGPAPP